MTVEELMKPRYEVIAQYPLCSWNNGRILELINGKYNCAVAPSSDTVRNPDNYPAVFRKMGWYEQIKTEDIPLFVKVKIPTLEGTYKVDKWENTGIDKPRLWFVAVKGNTGGRVFIQQTLPATEQEYKDYNSLTGTELAVKI